MRRSGMLIWSIAIALFLGAAAVAAASEPAAGPDPVLGQWPDWRGQVSCGSDGVPFSPRVALRRPADAEKGHRPAEIALRKFLDARRQPGEGRHDWRLLAENAESADFIRGSVVGESSEHVRLERVNGIWVGTFDWHPCGLHARRNGHPAVPWTLNRGQRLTASTSTIKVWIGSFECDNTDVKAPVFRREGDRLLMTLWPRPKPPSNLPCPEELIERELTIHLPRPLANLKLYDGGVFPGHLEEPPPAYPASRSAFLRQ
jgi:hypothetical protein